MSQGQGKDALEHDRRAVALLEDAEPSSTKARAIHERLGRRQAQILGVLEEAGGDGTNTGVISKAIDYDQPNVYLTLQSLVGLRFVDKDKTTDPHTYRLTPRLRD